MKNEEQGKGASRFRDQNSQEDEEEEGSLITYKEFINAIIKVPKLYKNILPRTLSFKEVILYRKSERVYTISDSHVDNFAMFRYEINSIFREHQFIDEEPTGRCMGRSPLSKA